MLPIVMCCMIWLKLSAQPNYHNYFHLIILWFSWKISIPLYLHVFNSLVISYVNYWSQIIDYLSTVIDNRDVIAMLIQPLLKLGLVDRVIGLLTNEIDRPPDEKLDRYVELTWNLARFSFYKSYLLQILNYYCSRYHGSFFYVLPTFQNARCINFEKSQTYLGLVK